jgi:glucokinase
VIKHTLTLDIGGTNFSAARFVGNTLAEICTQPTLRDGGPGWMLNQIETVVSRFKQGGKFSACGIGFGGPVDFVRQRVICSTHVEGWRDFDLVGALGEGCHGSGIGFRPLFYITLSTGIGGALLTDAGLFRGADSYACELGHHTVFPGGPQCICGCFGCLERMCCGLWIERDYGLSAKELFQDTEFVREYVVHLAQGLKNCIMFLNPARIVIGGGISEAGDLLFIPLRKELASQMPSWSKARIDVVPASLRGQSVLWGALDLAKQNIYKTVI